MDESLALPGAEPQRSRWSLLRARVRRLADAIAAPLPPDLARAFSAETLELDARHAAVLFTGLGLLNLAWTISDGVVLAGTPRAAGAFGTYRWVFSLVACAGGFVVQRRLAGRLLRPAIQAIGLVLATLIADGMGRLGGPGTPWFHFANFALLPTAALSLPTANRIGFNLLLGVCMSAALAQHTPGATASPFWPIYLSVHACIVILCTAAGILVERARRTAFAARREIERQSAELLSLNETLEERVRQQTEELRTLARSLEGAREEERTRLARELHDALGQELGALRYTLALAERRYGRDTASIGGDLAQLREQLAHTAETSRRIMLDLRPHLLEDLGLTAAADWLVRRTEQQSGIACRLALPGGQVDAAPSVSVAVFRLLQESLTNAAKHAQAKSVQVELARVGAAVRLSVRDDGVGLPPPEQRGRGMGLVGMRERVLALSGELSITSTPGGGTCVVALLPAPEESA